jgi:hypothetical protein
MSLEHAHQIARCLRLDLGLESGIKYAYSIARHAIDPSMAADYREAARILEAEQTTNAHKEATKP